MSDDVTHDDSMRWRPLANPARLRASTASGGQTARAMRRAEQLPEGAVPPPERAGLGLEPC